jgi:hypothetical protein
MNDVCSVAQIPMVNLTPYSQHTQLALAVCNSLTLTACCGLGPHARVLRATPA